MGIAIFLLSTVLVFVLSSKEVLIKIDDKELVYTFKGKQTVAEGLEKNGIDLKEEDKVEPSLNKLLEDGDTVNIKKAKPVKVVVDSKEYSFLTPEREVQKILEDIEIEIRDLDIVTPAIDSLIDSDSKTIEIIRVEEKYEDSTIMMQYREITQKNPNMDKGISKVIQQGKNGVKNIKEKVRYHNGQEVTREVVEETITQEPIDRINEVGTNTLIATSRGNQTFTKVIYAQATAYCAGTTTASGTTPRANRTIAASRNYSFGTKMYIPGLKASSNGGVFVVEDRGGAIKGNNIDIFFNTEAEARNFGRRTLKVYVLQ